MIRSRDVEFMEEDFEHSCLESVKSEDYNQFFDCEAVIIDSDQGENEVEDANNFNADREQIQIRKSARARNMPERFGTVTGDWWVNEDLDYAGIAFTGCNEPKSLKEALNGKHSSQWQNAMDSEYESLTKNGTWDLVNMPENKNLIGCKWVYKVKRNAEGNVDRFKARLVAQGFSQEKGADYKDVFAPVARYNSIRVVLAVANALNLELHQMDVKTAFLNGKLEEDIYMAQPEGCIDKDKPDMVCKLNKSLYGLKQSARCWNLEIDRFLKNSGYKQGTAGLCIYTKMEGRSKSFIVLALYVDDILLASNDTELLTAEKQKLSQRFEMEDLGVAKFCLGMSIKRDRSNRTLCVSQKSYLEDVLRRFGMYDCKPVSTPLEPNRVYKKLTDEEEAFNVKEYQAAIGSLNYAMIATRPDIASSVEMLSQFMSNPSKDHWQGIKRILRYIKGTIDYSLTFSTNNTDLKLCGYADADWANDTETRKSTSGYLFQLAGSTISWRSQRQSVVALSTTEAEYISLSSATQEAIWLRRLMGDLGLDAFEPTVMFEDNQSAICLAKNPSNHSRAKHVDIKYHFIREAIEKKEIELRYCPTDEMVADVLTKGIPRQKFEQLRTLMGVKK